MKWILLVLLSVTGLLSGHAQDHADRLSDSGVLDHSNLYPLLEKTGCEWIGENIYAGSDPARRWRLYGESPIHRQIANHPRTYHESGRGLLPDGRIVVVDIFCLMPTVAPGGPRAVAPAAPLVSSATLLTRPITGGGPQE